MTDALLSKAKTVNLNCSNSLTGINSEIRRRKAKSFKQEVLLLYIERAGGEEEEGERVSLHRKSVLLLFSLLQDDD